MHCHSDKDKNRKPGASKVFLIGNPNVGKSAVFGLLTGRYVTVSNYPGTTVELTRGDLTIHGENVTLIDTPGVNSLIPMSEDEKVTRDILLEEKAEAVVHVIDTKNIKRSLSITLQLIEMGVPLVIDLNMKDEADRRGIEVNEHLFSRMLGVDVVSTIAVQKKGISPLKKALAHPKVSSFAFSYEADIEKYISEIEPHLPEANISRRSLALMLLSGDETLREWLLKNLKEDKISLIESIRDRAAGKYPLPLSYIISQQRLKAVDAISEKILTRTSSEKRRVSGFLEEITIDPVFGLPFLLLVIYAMYEFVGSFGAGVLVDFIEETVFGQYLNPWAIKLVTALIPIQFLQELLIGQYGVITMALTYAIAIILPITTTFFIAFSIMEDSGYLPRLASMLNRVFRAMGLNGKAVLPMVLGLGCDTMATLTTRILDTPKERVIVTLLLALGVPCSAQLGVILGIFGKQPIAAFFIWASVLIGVIILVGYMAAKIIPGQRADFMLELPPLRLPQISNVLVKTVWRIEWYLKEAVPLFILGTLILFAADKLKILPLIERLGSPIIVSVLGLPAKATEAFLIGFLRRDYGSAGIFALHEQGMLNSEQVVVSLVTITLFIPCIANLFMIIKERGAKTAFLMTVFIFPFALLVGGLLHRILLWLRIFN
jgi:ferrous iron transport protein B